MRVAGLISTFALSVVAILASNAAMATTVSNFDTGAEGWVSGNIGGNTAINDLGVVTWVATGGKSGGYISATDDHTISAFIAPSSYLGDQSSAIGGALTFSLQAVSTDGLVYPNVVIYGAGTSMSYSTTPPGTTWTDYNIPLTSLGWTLYPGGENNGVTPVGAALFASIMANITGLAIEADWQTGSDLVGLDSVAFSGTAVTPIPAALPLFASALGGLGLVGWKRRKNTQA